MPLLLLLLLLLVLLSLHLVETTINGVSILSLGFDMACVVDGTDQVKCWGGDPSLGGYSVDTMGSQLPYLMLGSGLTVSALACGGEFCCSVFVGGTMRCWGINDYGQLGIGSTQTSLEPSEGSPFIDVGGIVTNVTCGAGHTCVLLESENVKCWGDNASGQLGLGVTTSPIGTMSTQMGTDLPEVNLGTDAVVTVVHAGDSFTCALLASLPSKIVCWGYNYSGQLGTGNSTLVIGTSPSQMGIALAPVNLGANAIPLDFATGAAFACAIVTGYQVKCWGDNSYKQLGRLDVLSVGTSEAGMGENLPFVDIGTGVLASRIVAGAGHVCILTAMLTVKCWGNNNDGELGLGYTTSYVPNGVNEMGDYLPYVQLGTEYVGVAYPVIGIGAGQFFTCAIVTGLLTREEVKCWGLNNEGQLGICSTVNVGANANQMGNNLLFVDQCATPTFYPTPSPTNNDNNILGVALGVPLSFFCFFIILSVVLVNCIKKKKNTQMNSQAGIIQAGNRAKNKLGKKRAGNNQARYHQGATSVPVITQYTSNVGHTLASASAPTAMIVQTIPAQAETKQMGKPDEGEIPVAIPIPNV